MRALIDELKHAYGDESVLEFDLRSWVPNPLRQKEEKVEQYVDGSHEQTVLGVYCNPSFGAAMTNITQLCVDNYMSCRFVIVFCTTGYHRANTGGRTLKWTLNSVKVDDEHLFHAPVVAEVGAKRRREDLRSGTSMG
mgnify:CR=1 FL=1